ncbi:MAG: histone family protein [Candidatus Micrarchaeota archaeon]|nr:histone family protein [Candidatus Micrarchaeota archaeon]
MPRKGSLIPAAPMAELMKRAGAERVSESAAKALSKFLIEIGLEISEEAVRLAKHAGRKTVKAEDVELAKRRIF